MIEVMEVRIKIALKLIHLQISPFKESNGPPSFLEGCMRIVMKKKVEHLRKVFLKQNIML
jgi:hypothetical protein